VGQGPPELSSRELEVVGLVVLGHTNREIGEQLSISMRTVQSHLSSSMEKLGARSRTQLAVVAICGGLVPCPGGRECDTSPANPPFGGLHCEARVGCNAAVGPQGPGPGGGEATTGPRSGWGSCDGSFPSSGRERRLTE
jgi:DNA-binding CsgD family transcriptional regulator